MKKIIVLFVVCTLALAGCSSKPSKGEVKSSLRKMILSEMGSDTDVTKKAAEAYSDCLVDEVYDKLSADTLNKIVDVKSSDDFEEVEGDEKENLAFDEAADKCSDELVQE